MLQHKYFYDTPVSILLPGRPVVPVLYASLIMLHICMVATWYDMSLQSFALITFGPIVTSMVCLACELGKPSKPKLHKQDLMPKLETVLELEELHFSKDTESFVARQLRTTCHHSIEEQQVSQKRSLDALKNDEERRCCFNREC